MTVHVWFMGHDLKSHERTIPDRKIAEAGTYDDRATFEDLVHRYLREVGDSVACITDICYEDDRMNLDNVKQFNELLWLNVPKKNRDSIRGMVSTRYVDPTHVVFVELRHGDSDAFVQFSGDAEMMIKKPSWDRSDETSTMIATDYLKKIVDNITAESVTIKVKDDYPITLEWTDGEDSFEVLIAHRVENRR